MFTGLSASIPDPVGDWSQISASGREGLSCMQLSNTDQRDQYSGHALRKNTAGAFGPDLARKLAQLVKMEKNVMRSMEMVAKERMETAV